MKNDVINLKGGAIMNTRANVGSNQTQKQDSFRVILADIRDYLLILIVLNIKRWWSRLAFRDYKYTPLIDQIKYLQNSFSSLNNVNGNIASIWQIPANSDGNFAMPDWRKIAPTYGAATNKVLVLIKNQCSGKFKNYLEDRLGSEAHNRQGEQSVRAWEIIRKEQNTDIYILPARVGLRRSLDHIDINKLPNINNASKFEIFELGLFEVGIILLTHPTRLKSFQDRWIRCGGNEFCCKANGRFNRRPFFSFISGKIRLGADLFKNMDEHCDPAIGFIPKKYMALDS